MPSESGMSQDAPVRENEVNSGEEVHEGCSFCEELFDTESISSPIVKEFFATFGRNTRVLFSTEKFFVVPSLGAMIPGHILLLPKNHYYSVGEMPEQDLREFELLAQEIRHILSSVYGCCSAFEHGCVEGAGKAGACVDHAHLHLLPIGKNLKSEIQAKFGRGIDIHSLSELRQFVQREIPYIYYEAPEGEARAYDAFLAPSQYFRQLVFAADPQVGNWDWKQDLRTSTVKVTYDALRGAFSEIEKHSSAR